MTKKILLSFSTTLFVFFLGNPATKAQKPPADSLYYRPLQRFDLKPIVIGANGRYYYGGIRLRRSSSLEIPFGELDDPDVNRHFKTYRRLNTAGVVLSFIPTVYFLAAAQAGTFNRRTYWQLYFGSIGGTLACTLWAEGQMRKAVSTYNLRLGKVNMGMVVEPLPTQSVLIGLGVSRALSH